MKPAGALLLALAAPAAAAPAAAGGVDAACWTGTGFFAEGCCHEDGKYAGCFDASFTWERCCGGRDHSPAGYEDWLRGGQRQAPDRYDLCSEYVKRFEFAEQDQSMHDRYDRCLKDRLDLARGAYRAPLLGGQHFPTVVSPGPEGLLFVLPATDFVVSKHVMRYGTFDPGELALYKAFLPLGGTALDIGANVGAYAVPLAVHAGREGLVIAAEPFQSLYQILTANSAINGLRNLRTRQIGVGEAQERVLARGPSLEKMTNVGMGRVFRAFEEKHAETFMLHYADSEPIQVTTLDKLMEAEEVQRVDLLKVDVEGHLKAVLAGGQDTVRRFRPVVVAEYSEDDALDLLQRDHGYGCRELLPQHDTWVCVPDPENWDAHLARLAERAVFPPPPAAAQG